jgi:hypothetical protein
MSSRSDLLLLPLATLLFALGAPTPAPAQNPCAGAGTPTPQCLAWQEQQKLNAACSQNPTKPECKDWLKQQQAKTKRTRPVGSGPGDKSPSGAATKAFKPGSTSLPAVQSPAIPRGGALGVDPTNPNMPARRSR